MQRVNRVSASTSNRSSARKMDAPLNAVSALRWGLTPDQIAAERAAIIEKATDVLDAVGRTEGPACTYDSVVAPLIKLDVDIEASISSVTFAKDVSPDADVREAAAEAQSALSAFEVKASALVFTRRSGGVQGWHSGCCAAVQQARGPL